MDVSLVRLSLIGCIIVRLSLIGYITSKNFRFCMSKGSLLRNTLCSQQLTLSDCVEAKNYHPLHGYSADIILALGTIELIHNM